MTNIHRIFLGTVTTTKKKNLNRDLHSYTWKESWNNFVIRIKIWQRW